MNVFFTDKLFGEAITKVRELLLFEYNHILMKTGILQTRDFIAPELYAEFIDASIRLIWFGMYREYYLELGLTDMTVGKYNAIREQVLIPVRIIELCEAILAPILIGKDVFCPSEKLVRCRYYTNVGNASVVWGIPVDPVVGLALRYGFSLRNSIVDRINQMPGAVSTAVEYQELPIVSRVIRFEDLSEDESKLLDAQAEPIAPVPLPRDNAVFRVNATQVQMTEQSLTHTNLCRRFRVMCQAIYRPEEFNYGDVKWFVPYVYNGIDFGDFGRLLSVYLPIVWKTDADIDSRDHGMTFGRNDVQIPNTYISVRGNDRRVPRSYVDLSTLSDLRRKEGRLSPPDNDEQSNRDNLITCIDRCWFENNFPSLEDPNYFVQVSWDISYVHPFLSVRSLTRTTKTGLNHKRQPKKVKTQGNIHGATTEGKINHQVD